MVCEGRTGTLGEEEEESEAHPGTRVLPKWPLRRDSDQVWICVAERDSSHLALGRHKPVGECHMVWLLVVLA